MSKLIPTPFKQGELDCLCGIYSLVNLMSWFYGNRIKPRSVFKHILCEYSEYWPLLNCLTDGIGISEMDYLIKRLLMRYHKKYPLRVTTPFRFKDKLTTSSILSSCQTYLCSHSTSKRAILLGDFWHWSIITEIDKQFLYFFDSGNYDKINRASYSLTDNKTRKLFTDAIYWFEVT